MRNVDPEHKARRDAKRLAIWKAKTFPNLKIWDRQDDLGDTAESWPYFQAFRDAKGSRRLDRVRQALDERATRPAGSMPTLSQLREWHDNNQWAKRVQAYDAYMDSILQEEKEIILKRTAEQRTARHLSAIDDLTETVEHEAVKLAERARVTDGEVMKAADVFKAAEVIVKLERLVRGDATEHTKTDLDLSGMSDEALEELAGAWKKGKK